ncbi:hypothetical protein [Nocardia sp. MW-W600-9]
MVPELFTADELSRYRQAALESMERAHRFAEVGLVRTTDVLRLAFAVTFADAGTATYQPLPGQDCLPMRVGEPIDPERHPRVGSMS